jgi:hypothetical protein
VGDITGESQEYEPQYGPDDRALLDRSPDDGDEESSETRAREGLPPTFQMRHDAHYVDQLIGRPAAVGIGTPAPAVGPLAALCPAVALDLAESLEAASACLTLNTGETRNTFTGRVAKELLGIELNRARRLARAAAFLSAPHQPRLHDLLISGLIQDVVAATDPSRRMLGVKMDVAIADRETWMRADGQLLTLALAGTADAMLSQMTGPGAAMRLAVRGIGVSSSVSVEISMTPAPPPVPSARLFDARDAEHPWGASAGLLLSAAAQVAHVHRGRVDVRTPAAGECTIGFLLPRR